MTVAELIERLSEMDPDARVFLMMQPSWPFEYSISGVTTRDDFTEREYDEDGNDVSHIADDNERPSDVFLCEGQQLRYGNKDAWNSTW